MSKSALITGATGLLGRQVLRIFEREGWTVTGTGFSRASASIIKLDLTDASAVSQVLDDVKPQVVVHCAANRFPDKCDNDPEGTKALNIAATASLAKSAAQRGILLIYISTDYVFSGIEGQAPYEVTSTPQPPNLYGDTKWEGEKTVSEAYKAGRAVILRVPVLYGEAETPAESAVNSLLDKVWVVQKGKMVEMDHWAVRYPTNTEDVARVLQGTSTDPSDIATLYLSTPSSTILPKTLQFSSEDAYTKYEICQLLAEILGLPLPPTAMIPQTQGNDPSATVQRPYDCHLSTKALKELGVAVHAMDFVGWWRRELRAFRRYSILEAVSHHDRDDVNPSSCEDDRTRTFVPVREEETPKTPS